MTDRRPNVSRDCLLVIYGLLIGLNVALASHLTNPIYLVVAAIWAVVAWIKIFSERDE